MLSLLGILSSFFVAIVAAMIILCGVAYRFDMLKSFGLSPRPLSVIKTSSDTVSIVLLPSVSKGILAHSESNIYFRLNTNLVSFEEIDCVAGKFRIVQPDSMGAAWKKFASSTCSSTYTKKPELVAA